MRLIFVTLAISLIMPASPTLAQQASYDGNLAIPLIAETPSYASKVFIHNPGVSTVDVSFSYTGATSSATPGPVTCNAVAVRPGNVIATSLGELCPLLNAGTNFGRLTSSATNYIALYSRVQTPSGNGFSVEGIDQYDCCFYVREVTGLVRQTALPGYQSNCFIFNRESRAGRVVVSLISGDGHAIASQLLSIAPAEFVRLLDVFAMVGAPAGDYSNVRASFESIVPVEGGSPAFLNAACTVQNNTSFDADFRVAKWHL